MESARHEDAKRAGPSKPRKPTDGSWRIPVSDNVVLVDDNKALKLAVHEVRPSHP